MSRAASAAAKRSLARVAAFGGMRSGSGRSSANARQCGVEILELRTHPPISRSPRCNKSRRRRQHSNVPPSVNVPNLWATPEHPSAALGDEVHLLEDHVGCQLDQRGNGGDAPRRVSSAADAGAPMIIEDESAGSTARRRSRSWSLSARESSRNAAGSTARRRRGRSVSTISARGGAAIVGVDIDACDDATLRIDFGDLEEFDLEGLHPWGFRPAKVLECQPVARGGEQSARQSCSGGQLGVAMNMSQPPAMRISRRRSS